MPLYEYQCRNCKRIQEVFVHSYKDVAEFNGGPEKCVCGGIVFEKLWSKPANLQIGKPTVVFVNPETGDSRVATFEHEQPPPGFVKEELKSSIERTRFENVQNKINSEKDEIYNELRYQERNAMQKDRYDQINAELSTIAAQSDNAALTESLMKAAMTRGRKKSNKIKKRKTEFVFDINHKDKSNL